MGKLNDYKIDYVITNKDISDNGTCIIKHCQDEEEARTKFFDYVRTNDGSFGSIVSIKPYIPDECNYIRKSTTIEDANGNYVKYSSITGTKSDEPKDTSMMTLDFAGMFPSIPHVEILDIYVRPEDRRKGIGTRLLDEVAEDNKNSVILLASGASEKEYPEEPDPEEGERILNALGEFYYMNDFLDVNDIIGGYLTKRACIYTNNTLGDYCYDKMLELREKNKKELEE